MRGQVGGRGDASVETAWQRYADLDAWSDWSPQIRKVRSDRRQLAPGLRGAVVGPFGLAVPFEVLAVDSAARQWVWRVSMLGVKVQMTHALRVEGDRTVASLIADGPAVVVLPYLPIAAVALGRLTRA